MKAELNEFDCCFSIDFTPETVADAATLVRLKLNGVTKLTKIGVSCHRKQPLRDSSIDGYVLIGKRKQPISEIKP